MRIEQSSQVYQGYQKSTAPSASSKTFGQVLAETNARDRYVPSAPSPRAKTGFSVEERTYYGRVTVSNATQAKLKQLAELNAQADYSGMSPEEIYAEIWNRYDEAFDGNMIAIKGCIAGPEEWCVINNQFCDEIVRHIFNPAIHAASKEAGERDGKLYAERSYEERAALDRSCREKADKVVHDAKMKVLGYEGMSFEERESAIKEKYAGKNTTLDFLKMQSELQMSGVLCNKMGLESTRLYCAMMSHQFEVTFNPNSIYNVGHEKCSFMTADQWNRVAAQPFDAAKLAVALKKQLSSISGPNDYSPDYVKMMENFFDHFVKGITEDSLDRLIGETKQ